MQKRSCRTSRAVVRVLVGHKSVLKRVLQVRPDWNRPGEGHTVSDAKGTRRLRRWRWSAGASHTLSHLGWLESEHSEFGKHTSRVIWKSLAHGKSCVFGIFLDRDDLPLDETVCWESISCRWDFFFDKITEHSIYSYFHRTHCDIMPATFRAHY